MTYRLIERVGQRVNDALAAFGSFCQFVGWAIFWFFGGGLRWRNLRLLFPQLYDIGVMSVPVIGITGAFIGMVMAIETYTQFKSLGQEERLGVVIILSVVKQIGPVMAAMMLAGRIGGALTAELGTMNVTEQLDALRVMGTDPIRFLVVPRFFACLILAPVLTIYSDIAGILGGWFIAVKVMGVPNGPFWHYAQLGVEPWQINEGIIKAFFFGAAIALISCYKGFHCGSGASGVGRACTESFVASFISIIAMDFFFAKLSQSWYETIYGVRSLLGG
jgi:phospholipid/cholesterol/gamma-HCH transport system permease protein